MTTTFACKTARTVAFNVAKGDYQLNLLRGVEAWNGSTLKGKARNYSGRYAASRANLRARLEALKISVDIIPGPRGGAGADAVIGRVSP